ncbi:hypothetical protein X777_04271, partial [Ooceraea biroi]
AGSVSATSTDSFGLSPKYFSSSITRPAEEPLRGITPPALTQSGSEAYLAFARERIQGYGLTWKRIATGFMYQEDGGSGRLSPSGRSGMTSRLGVISHALVASGIVMRVLSRECRYELAAGRQRETTSEVAGRGFPSL